MIKQFGGIMLRFLSAGIALVLTLSFAGCVKKEKPVSVLSFLKDEAVDIYPQSPDKSLHKTDTAKLKELAKSGLITLFIDERTYSIAVLESLNSTYWYTLPILPADYAGEDNNSAVASVTVVNGSETIYMNTQDNAVAFGKASYKVEANSVLVTYTLTVDRETAEKSTFEENDIAFSLEVKYELEAGSLYVSCKNRNLSGNKNARIVELGLLEFFGASSSAQAGDFMLVPDASGALIYTAVEDPGFEKQTFRVYGNDPAGAEAEGEKQAVVAAYGIKRGNDALAVLVEKGDAIARISAHRAADGGFNRVGPSFTITEVEDVEKNDKVNRYISESAYTEEVILCLRFLSGPNATYSGMAAVCREQLIRNKILSTKTVTEEDYLPFNLTVTGAVKKNIIGRMPIESTVKLTTFEQAQDIIERIKSKGINSISLRYKGALSGGLNQHNISNADISRRLGGSSGFSELSMYMSTQKMKLYLDIDILSSDKKMITAKSKTIQTLTQEKGFTAINNELSDYIGEDSFSRALRPIADLEKAVLRTLTKFRNTQADGFCLNDVGKLLYSDYSKQSYNREAAADEIVRQITSLSTGRKMMVDTGNFFAIKNADVIVNIPMPTQSIFSESQTYQYVPFIQLILHGIIDYSGQPINTALNTENSATQPQELTFGNKDDRNQKELMNMMLRYIEYGACPSYEWTYKKLDQTKTIETYYFDDWMNQAADFYTKANAALADLRGLRMVKHSQIQPGVFCTEYEGSNMIYVNYTYSDIDVGGVSVKARNFFRIRQ